MGLTHRADLTLWATAKREGSIHHLDHVSSIDNLNCVLLTKNAPPTKVIGGFKRSRRRRGDGDQVTIAASEFIELIRLKKTTSPTHQQQSEQGKSYHLLNIRTIATQQQRCHGVIINISLSVWVSSGHHVHGKMPLSLHGQRWW